MDIGTPKSFNIPPFGENYRNTQLSIDAIEINDDMSSTVEEKMKSLTELFSKHDLKLIFV